MDAAGQIHVLPQEVAADVHQLQSIQRASALLGIAAGMGRDALKGAGMRDFASVKDQLIDFLKEQKVQQATEKYISDLEKAAKVQYMIAPVAPKAAPKAAPVKK